MLHAPRTGLHRFKEEWLTPRRVWLGVFALWALFLTGVLSPIGGGPGVLQAWRLYALDDNKDAQIAELESEIEQLGRDAERLEKSRVAQEREIRRVLGYAAPDEIIFDFTAADRIAGTH